MGSFPKELDSAWRKRESVLGRELSGEEGTVVEGKLFEAWIAAGRYDELIRRIHSIHAVEGGLTDIIVLGYSLREKRDIERIHALFRGLLNRRLKAFWSSWPYALQGHVGHMVAASKSASATMEVYLEYFHSLTTVGLAQESDALHIEMLAFQARERGPPNRKFRI